MIDPKTDRSVFGLREKMRTETKPTIIVRTPCTCNAKRWFYCTCSTVVVRYECHNEPDGSEMVHSADIAFVERAHPGMDLIY